jgi:gamma-glutamyltranspeptidase/glutathione hydrolase
MLEHLVQNWHVRKPLVRSRGGVVASQNRLAAAAGARILAAGGNAVDAAIATSFALGAVEPWNSGMGGIGFMLVYLARENRVQVIDFGPISPRKLDPADYPLTGGYTTDLFTWPTVKDDRNVHGPASFAVPGQVAGMGLALERFGTKPFAELLQPAIELADKGIAVDWFLTLKVATTAAELSRYPSSRAVWLPKGLPPVTLPNTPLGRLKLTGLADTLQRLAQGGPRDFYEGAVARRILDDIASAGGIIDADDLAQYHARLVAPIEIEYGGANVALAPKLTAGPSIANAFGMLAKQKFSGSRPDASAYVAYAQTLREVYADRLQSMGDDQPEACTTHFNVGDRDGNLVAVTQTLLSVFGSRYVLPNTGILMNNGVMWFDPRPGSPNYLGPGKRPLTNMCPVIVRRPGGGGFAIGASGGRKIMPAVMQLTSFLLDHGMTLEDAFHQPRIDASGGEFVGADPRLPEEVRAALAAKFPVTETELVVYPTNFACPSSVLHDAASGERFAMTDVLSPWSGAAAEGA